MGKYDMIAFIVLVVVIGSVIRAAFGHRRGGRRDRQEVVRDEGEAQRLREEVKMLRERVQVLERITVEKENSLEREIERLRDH